MERSETDSLTGSDAIGVETVLITVVGVFIFYGPSEWQYFWFFKGAYVVVLLILLVRVMAGRAENPHEGRIRQSIRWSSTFLQITLIGTLSIVTLWITELLSFPSEPAVMAITALALFLLMFLVDELVLRGEILDTWEEAVTNADNELVRNYLTVPFKFGKQHLRGGFREDEIPTSTVRLKAAGMALGLLIIIFLISIPILVILLQIFGGIGYAFLIVLSIFFIRDMSRSIYLNYGNSITLSDLRWKLRWEFLWFVIRGLLLAGALGFDMTYSLHL